MNKTKKHFRIKEERIALIQLFENLTFDEKKQILKHYKCDVETGNIE